MFDLRRLTADKRLRYDSPKLPYFDKLKGKNFRTINFDRYKEDIKRYSQPYFLKESNSQVHRK